MAEADVDESVDPSSFGASVFCVQLGVRTVVVSVTSLFDRSGSAGEAADALAALDSVVSIPGAVTTIVTICELKAAISPRSQVTVPALSAHDSAGSAETKVAFPGSVSSNVTAVAVTGPWFVTSTV